MAQLEAVAERIIELAEKGLAKIAAEELAAVEHWFEKHVGKPVLRGFPLFGRYVHLTTRSEAEAIYDGRDTDCWFPPKYRVEGPYGERRVPLRRALKAARLAIALPGSTVLLQQDEINALKEYVDA